MNALVIVMTKMSESNEWWTLEQDFDKLCKKYQTVPLLDVAATNSNTRSYYYIDKKLDALKRDWIIKSGNCRWMRDYGTYTGNTIQVVDIWLNEPTLKGMTKEFMLKAYEQWNKFGMSILSIFPAGSLFRKYSEFMWDLFDKKQITIKPLLPRPRFLFEGKETEFQARNDYAVIHFKRKDVK